MLIENFPNKLRQEKEIERGTGIKKEEGNSVREPGFKG